MLGRYLLLIITSHISRVLAEEFYGTYCHSKKLFPYPEVPFDTFCADLYQRDEVDVDARLRFSTRNNVEVATPVVPFEWEMEEMHTFEVHKLVVNSTELRNGTGLNEWLNKAGKLLKIDAKLSPESLRIYPTPSTRYQYKYRLTVAIEKYHLVLDDEEPMLQRKPVKKGGYPGQSVVTPRPRPAVAGGSSKGRVGVGSYEVYGQPSGCLSTKVDIRERDENLEAKFTFKLLDGSEEEIDYMVLSGDRVMKVDKEVTDPMIVMLSEMYVWNVQAATNIRGLALGTITIEAKGNKQILVNLGRARDGSPAATAILDRVSGTEREPTILDDRAATARLSTAAVSPRVSTPYVAPVKAGTYSVFGHPSGCLSTEVDIREKDEALEARFTFDLPEGNGETIDYMRLSGDRVMKVDEGDTDPTNVMVAEMQVWNVQEHTGVRDLALNNIAIEPNGDDRILLHLGVARDGSPAETVELAKVSS
ncbi:hypothetical protein FOZ60_000368 [Perkinsus olseni]|uniref:Protein arginine methyltransferase 10 n=1 Tax=Perkinsus olseni TaxID=32597 RepID=A0A7J6P3I0_PEROL|nr:hypothetical protein FOZ60_000368 [Perkinsus olseni]